MCSAESTDHRGPARTAGRDFSRHDSRLGHCSGMIHVAGKRVEVYGPASRSAVVQATDPSAVIGNTAAERSGCYLVVYHGHFDWHGPSPGAKQRHYTVLTNVWCAKEGGTDLGLRTTPARPGVASEAPRWSS
jgi:hypothetical protein